MHQRSRLAGGAHKHPEKNGPAFSNTFLHLPQWHTLKLIHIKVQIRHSYISTALFYRKYRYILGLTSARLAFLWNFLNFFLFGLYRKDLLGQWFPTTGTRTADGTWSIYLRDAKHFQTVNICCIFQPANWCCKFFIFYFYFLFFFYFFKCWSS